MVSTGFGKRRVKKQRTRNTYTQAILECLASDGQRLEELRNRLAACLGVASCASRRTLSRREVGDALGRGDGDIGPGHCGRVEVTDLDIQIPN